MSVQEPQSSNSEEDTIWQGFRDTRLSFTAGISNVTLNKIFFTLLWEIATYVWIFFKSDCRCYADAIMYYTDNVIMYYHWQCWCFLCYVTLRLVISSGIKNKNYARLSKDDLVGNELVTFTLPCGDFMSTCHIYLTMSPLYVNLSQFSYTFIILCELVTFILPYCQFIWTCHICLTLSPFCVNLSHLSYTVATSCELVTFTLHYCHFMWTCHI